MAVDSRGKELGLAGTTISSPDDLSLMDAIAAGDRKALALLYERHAPLLLAICRRVLNDADEADDVLVDVMFEVWAKADRFNASRGNPVTYLTTLARSRSIDRRRSRASRPPLGGDGSAELSNRPAHGADPFEHAELDEQSTRVRAALSDLTDDQRVAVECAYYEGLSHSEVANKLGKPLGTVKTLIRHGLIRLRDALRIER